MNKGGDLAGITAQSWVAGKARERVDSSQDQGGDRWRPVRWEGRQNAQTTTILTGCGFSALLALGPESVPLGGVGGQHHPPFTAISSFLCVVPGPWSTSR